MSELVKQDEKEGLKESGNDKFHALPFPSTDIAAQNMCTKCNAPNRILILLRACSEHDKIRNAKKPSPCLLAICLLFWSFLQLLSVRRKDLKHKCRSSKRKRVERNEKQEIFSQQAQEIVKKKKPNGSESQHEIVQCSRKFKRVFRIISRGFPP